MVFGNRHGAARRLVAIGLVGVFALAACSSSDGGSTSGDSAGGTQSGDTTGDTTGGGTTGDTTAGGSSDAALLIARGMDVNSLDPSRAYCDTCQIFMTAVYETLIGLDKDNTTLVPRLATKWEGNADQTEFTFTLDPKATFADGSPVTSADVKWSWERLKGLVGASSYLVGTIATIDTPDAGTVKVTLSQSNSAFLAQVNASYLGIINSKAATAQGATADPTTDKAEPWFLENSAGSGPYMLESYQQGSELRLKRNDNYWGTKANFPEVVIKETPDAVTQRQQLEAGSVDIAMQISNDAANGMGGGDVTVEQVPSFNFVYLAVSPGAKGAEQLTPKVREAIRLALDYTGLLDATVGGAGQPQPSPIPNGFAGTDGLAPPVQDVEKAKSLLAEEGVTELTLDATYPSLNVYGVDFSTAMQKVQTDLKAVGISLQLNPVEISVWADKISSDGIPVTMLYFAPDHTDSSQYVQYFGLLEGSQWQTWGGTDVSQEQTDLLDKALAEQDAAARADIYKQLAESMIADNVIIPVVNPNLFLAARSDIKGLYYSACCNLVLADLSRG